MYSQTKVIEDIADYKLLNNGVLSNNDNSVDGYYFFYKVDDLEDRKTEYAIIILDKNLNETARKSYIGAQNSKLIQGVFDGNQISFLFMNEPKKFLKIIGFDRKGKEVESLKYELSRTDIIFSKKQRRLNNEIRLIPISKKGVLLRYFKNHGEHIGFISTNKKENWNTDSPIDTIGFKEDLIKQSELFNSNLKQYNFLGIGKSYIAFNEITTSSYYYGYDREIQSIFFKILKVDTGEEIYSEEIKLKIKKKEEVKSYLNVVFTEDGIMALGKYYIGSKNLKKGKSAGIFVDKISYAGEIESTKNINWEDQLFEKFQEENSRKGKNHIFFHDIIKTEDGYIAIGEQYRKVLTEEGFVSKLITLGIASATKILISDAYFFEFDQNFNLKDIKKITKKASLYSGLSDLKSAEESAQHLKFYGYFDYLMTQNKGNRFFSTFVNTQLDKKKKPTSIHYKTVIYKDSKYSESSFTIPLNDNIKRRVLPAKFGHLLIYEYDKETEKSSLRLEKIDAE